MSVLGEKSLSGGTNGKRDQERNDEDQFVLGDDDDRP